MKTQNINKLKFDKRSVIELNSADLISVNGGGQTTLVCGDCVTRPTFIKIAQP